MRETGYEALTPAGQMRRLRPLAREVLARYGIEPVRLQTLSSHWNALFRIDGSGGERYVLRIGRERGRSRDEVAAEVLWLEALLRDGDVPVPEVLPALDGSAIATAGVEGVPGERHCVLFRWVDGRSTLPPTPGRAHLLGVTMARLHNHADRWQPPAELARTALDSVWMFGGTNAILSDEPHPLLPPGRKALFRAAALRSQRAIDALHADRSRLRFLHADMHLGNVKLLPDGGLAILDFDDSTWCAPVQDIAIALFSLLRRPDGPRLRDTFRQGYADIRPWPERFEGEIDLHIDARMLDILDFRVMYRPDWERIRRNMEWAERRLRERPPE